ncbi:MAG: glycine cleavage system aminomethyltransferase GcvT [Zestosphaera sp.]
MLEIVKEVPLLDVQKELGGNVGEFAGWVTSMDYGNPLEEHMNTRTSASVFDVSHMGRYVIRGRRVFEFLQKLVSKDLSEVGAERMSGPVLLMNENAGIKDDIMLYNVSEDLWLAVVNAPNVEKDLEWMNVWRAKWGYTDVEIENVTLKSTLIAIQGPKAAEVMENLGFAEARNLKILEFAYGAEVAGKKTMLVSHSGWTGEEVRSFGFEIWTDVNHGAEILRKSVALGAKPAGLIARDALRLEMGYLLIGQDMDENTNPVEARYWLPISLEKEDCIGCPKLREIYERGVSRIRVGLKLKKGLRVIPRHGAGIYAGNNLVGKVTSGAFSPYLNTGVAMGYVNTSHAYIGSRLDLEVRGGRQKAKIVDFPLI